MRLDHPDYNSLDNVTRACLYVIEAIKGGMEFPDATSRACTMYKVTSDEVIAMYDACEGLTPRVLT
jgi:hypothetical protein